jgi:hypothetical protein
VKVTISGRSGAAAIVADILDNLELGFMGTYRATRERLSITVDAIYMGLGSNGRGPEGFVKVARQAGGRGG